MAYRYGDRYQLSLFPPSVEDYVPENAPVRAYDAMVEALDFDELGIEIDPNNVGKPQYDPKAMLKLLVYGTAYGVRSSRKLERESHYNISFIWLMKQLKPDHKTIAEFRRKNKDALANVLRQCARICIGLGLIEGNTLFIDGSKIRANASIKNKWTKDRCKEALKKADERIEGILKECEEADSLEEGSPSYVKMKEEISNQAALKAKIQDIQKHLKENNIKQHNTTDPECAVMNSQKGTYSGYNAQIVVDEKHSLIVTTDAVSDNNDLKQLAVQVDRANEVLGAPCKTACADSGYSATDEADKVTQKNINVIVPSQRQARGTEPGEFDKTRFNYERTDNTYTCPEGHTLKFRESNPERKIDRYQIVDPGTCRGCRNYGRCTKNKQGRTINRMWSEDIREKLEKKYLEPESQAIYKLRQQKVEHPFGHIKRNLKFDSFLMRGKDAAKAEIAIAATCFNMARMITLFGVVELIRKLQG